ncbi:indole-3-glycerol phosphate synthase TrpC [Thermosulfuriphilus ammonigenes]|uniref:Indole-3-glycerol phosphate synthase n=1 Tax=Thermosulfuriphilus ammonigenes TaxID=1936021 RepID=A0A6G7PVX8_9BACT|nr:indole-3-glycerol phosphate synthase TrpC [Thermosulfuriphilus ammonigenes]MBA2848154.1 indole-3-glycerol phosphate synthase [Thermosulfuriphilus ammonigenes]QIJ71671.1 indole-3-glycerol phosphate synthase TrpC [Thermosulfuriphilus ammonigenes]
MTILEEILAQKELEVAALKARGLSQPEVLPEVRPFKEALVRPGISIIAEIKRASPSKGLIAADFDPVAIARDYEAGGAAAISVLTDKKYFKGSLAYIPQVKRAVTLPILRKDFIIDEIQIEEARYAGADAVLLIVAALSPRRLSELLACVRKWGLEALVEVHDASELSVAISAGAEIVGINNRNLKDFTVDIETTVRLRPLIPQGVVVVSESGLKGREDIQRLEEVGVDAALIGESLMREKNRVAKLRELLGKGREAT